MIYEVFHLALRSWFYYILDNVLSYIATKQISSFSPSL